MVFSVSLFVRDRKLRSGNWFHILIVLFLYFRYPFFVHFKLTCDVLRYWIPPVSSRKYICYVYEFLMLILLVLNSEYSLKGKRFQRSSITKYLEELVAVSSSLRSLNLKNVSNCCIEPLASCKEIGPLQINFWYLLYISQTWVKLELHILIWKVQYISWN